MEEAPVPFVNAAALEKYVNKTCVPTFFGHDPSHAVFVTESNLTTESTSKPRIASYAAQTSLSTTFSRIQRPNESGWSTSNT